VAVSKYADHLPLERQVKIMKREGLDVQSQTLWDQIDALAKHLSPLRDLLRAAQLSQPVVGVDETTWRVMGSKNTKNKRWCACRTHLNTHIAST
jgi:transposase